MFVFLSNCIINNTMILTAALVVLLQKILQWPVTILRHRRLHQLRHPAQEVPAGPPKVSLCPSYFGDVFLSNTPCSSCVLPEDEGPRIRRTFLQRRVKVYLSLENKLHVLGAPPDLDNRAVKAKLLSHVQWPSDAHLTGSSPQKVL